MPGLVLKLGSIDEQRELFLWKFADISRTAVIDLEKDFKKFDIQKRGELDEHEAAMLLEHRSMTKTASQIRGMISAMDADKNHNVSFIEWCCAVFEKSYDVLNDFADEEAREKALAIARVAAEKAKIAEEEIIKAKELEELTIKLKEAEIEAESKLTGVAGKSAFFKRQAENTKDVTLTNEEKIKAEAARRKALREAKKEMQDAMVAATTSKSAEEIEKEIKDAAEAAAAAEAARIAKEVEDEKAARAARKAAMNAKWESPK